MQKACALAVMLAFVSGCGAPASGPAQTVTCTTPTNPDQYATCVYDPRSEPSADCAGRTRASGYADFDVCEPVGWQASPSLPPIILSVYEPGGSDLAIRFFPALGSCGDVGDARAIATCVADDAARGDRTAQVTTTPTCSEAARMGQHPAWRVCLESTDRDGHVRNSVVLACQRGAGAGLVAMVEGSAASFGETLAVSGVVTSLRFAGNPCVG